MTSTEIVGFIERGYDTKKINPDLFEDKIQAVYNLNEMTTITNPVGAVIAFAGSSAPDGWLMCDNNAISRVTYAVLYSVIGTTYGVGDGSTTFNLPDLRGIFIRGAGTSAKLSNANGTAFAGTAGTYQNDKFQGHLRCRKNRYGRKIKRFR
jgi:phage-related tail fiber protein